MPHNTSRNQRNPRSPTKVTSKKVYYDDLILLADKQILRDTKKWVVAGHFMRTLQPKYRIAIIKAVLKVFEPYLRIN